MRNAPSTKPRSAGLFRAWDNGPVLSASWTFHTAFFSSLTVSGDCGIQKRTGEEMSIFEK